MIDMATSIEFHNTLQLNGRLQIAYKKLKYQTSIINNIEMSQDKMSFRSRGFL